MSCQNRRAQLNDSKNRSLRNQFQKFSYLITTIALIFVFFYIVNTEYLLGYNVKVNLTTFFVNTKIQTVTTSNDSKPEMKYILLWTNEKSTPFVYFGEGQKNFVSRKCKWTNCYITADRNFLGYYTEFDVIAFNGPQLSNILNINDLPTRRSMLQKYVFANIEAAGNYQIYSKTWNNFFNWTWTYKLNSDAIWGYLVIRNATKHVIGPRTDMHWMKWFDMDPIDDELKEQLKTKKTAAAWFSSNCNTASHREDFVKLIQEELKEYGLQVDIYGTCGKFHCPREIMDKCLKVLKKQYYFYFAFENAFSADYVTEKIVYALNNNVVPVVYGTANYSRFMPEGIYLDALQLGPKKLAQKMNEIIANPQRYHDFFRWKKYYSYHFRGENPDTDDYCTFCALLNDDVLMSKKTVYEDFQSWWMEGVPVTESIKHISENLEN